MAIVSPAPATIIRQQQLTVPPRAIFYEYTVPGILSSPGEIVEESPTGETDETIYVAVGKSDKKKRSVKENKSILIWASEYFRGKRICLLHVHQPAQKIPIMGAKFPVSALKEQEVDAFRKIEKQDMDKLLEKYLLLCRQMGARAEKISTDNGCIEQGILELISRHGIKKLIMGAAADRRYSRNMKELKSRKALSIRDQAPVSCHIWFICKGNIVDERNSLQQTSVNSSMQPSSQQGDLGTGTGSCIRQSNSLRSHSITLGQNNYERPTNDVFRRVQSLNPNAKGGRATTPTTLEDINIAPQRRSEASSDEAEVLSRWSSSQCSVLSTCSSSGMSNLGSLPLITSGGSETHSELSTPSQLSPSLPGGSSDDPLYDKLKQVMSEAENSRREAFVEAGRRSKAEKDAIVAIIRAKQLEGLYMESSRQRRQLEEALAKGKEELEMMKSERDKVMEELNHTLSQKSRLDVQIAECDENIMKLNKKLHSSVDLMERYKRQRDELKLEHDTALREAEELKRRHTEASHSPLSYSEFSFAEIEEATHKFDQSLVIGEGGYGTIYKGVLHHAMVAVKLLNPHHHSKQGPREFQQEVDVLSKMRHPNIITLIGACPELYSLVYEYLENGSLEDRLGCRDNSPPLSWQTRIRIATELCSALILLHSSKPYRVVHGDLKPANILLDAHLVTKLSDFGTCRLLLHDESSNENVSHLTAPKGTPGYVDPEYLTTGELTTKADVYAFGIILLRLLTGKPAPGITKEVQSALEKGNLKSIIDPLAGDWPFVQAEQLAHLALSCCKEHGESRPDLASGVWRILEPMRAAFGDSSSFRIGSGEHRQPPPYFFCPIFQEVMRDPHIAADGYTYEAEAFRGWLDSGRDTSPTNDTKLAHFNLIPNRALRSAIQEWLQVQQ